MSEIYEALKKAERDKENRTPDAQMPVAEADRRSAPISERSSSSSAIPAEEYQKMSSALRTIDTEREIKAILFLSSVRGEGTSSVCAQFARSIVQGSAEKVLLVDANLRRPSIHSLFGLERESGLADVLDGQASASDMIRKTEIPGLSIITAGTPTQDAPRLLGSAHFKKTLAEWKQHYSWVIFDSSPALAYADAVILGRLLDGVILVVQAGKTRWEIIRRAQEILKNAKANILGVVLNKRQYVIPRPIYRRL